MAGTVDIVTRAFAGLQIRDDSLSFDPCLPDALHRVQFEVQFRGQRVDVTLDHIWIRLAAHPCAAAPPVCVRVAGTVLTLDGGHVLLVDHRTGATGHQSTTDG